MKILLILLCALIFTVKAHSQVEFTDYKSGIESFKSGKYEEAIRDINNALKVNPDFLYGHVMIGLAYYEMKKFDEAISNFNKYVSLSNDQGQIADEVHLYLARAYRRKSNYEKAIYEVNLYEMRTEVKPIIQQEKAELYLDYERHLSKGKSKSNLKERIYYYDKAKEILLRLQEMKYVNKWFINDLGRIKLREGIFGNENPQKITAYEEAIEYFKKEAITNKDKSVMLNIAVTEALMAEAYANTGWNAWRTKEKAKNKPELRDPEKAKYNFGKSVEKYSDALAVYEGLGEYKAREIDVEKEIERITKEINVLGEVINKIK